MSGDVIKEFLVGLGYKVDESSQRKFNEAAEKATGVINTLGKAVAALSIGAAAYAAVNWLDKMVGGMDKMYYAAKRAGGASGEAVKNLQAFAYAASQMGSSKDEAMQSAVGLHQKILNNPMYESWLQSSFPGITTRDSSGQMLSGESILEQIGAKMANMQPMWQKAYADKIGMPDNLRFALMDSAQFKGFEDENTKRNKQLGINPDKAVTGAHKLQVALGRLREAFARASEGLTTMLTDHMPMIEQLMTRFFNAVTPRIKQFIEWASHLTDKQIKDGLKALGVILALFVGGKLLGGVLGMTAAVLGAGPAIIAMAGAAAAFAIWYNNKHPHPEDGTWGYVYNKVGAAVTGFMGAFDANARDAWRRNHGQLPANHSGDMIHPQTGAGVASGGFNAQAFMRGLEARFGDPDGLLDAVWAAESGRGKHMLSSAGAQGHFQFMPGTAAAYGVTNPNNFRQSATGAARLFAHLIKKYGGNLDMALAAYNWGEGNLDAKGLGRAPKETRDYIQRIEGIMRNPYGSERARNGSGAAPGGVRLNSTTTIHVDGSRDPNSTATAIANKQASVNQRLQRNFRQVYA